MRTSPSIVPGIDRDVYLALDDFGRMGCAWRETNVEDTDLEAVIQDLWEGQYSDPVRSATELFSGAATGGSRINLQPQHQS